MKRLLLAAFTMLLIASCSFTPVLPQAEWEAYATARAQPVPPVTIEPQVVPPTATEEILLPTVTPTPECVNAKANISASGERIYHLPGDANYNTVKIDKDGEAIYCTEQEAIDAGFRHAQK